MITSFNKPIVVISSNAPAPHRPRRCCSVSKGIRPGWGRSRLQLGSCRRRRSWHGRGGRMPSRPPAIRSSSWPWATCSRTGSTRATPRSSSRIRGSPNRTLPEDKKLVGFDAYKQAMDALDRATSPSLPLRWRFAGCTSNMRSTRDLNVFMEKPIVADGPQRKRMLDLAKKADEKNLKVRGGPDGSSLPRPSGAAQADSRRRDRRHRHHAGLPHARPGGLPASRLASRPTATSCPGKSSGSTASFGPAAGCLATSTCIKSMKRRLDEKRLAGKGAGPGRPPLSRRLRRSEFRRLLRRVHVRGRIEALF